MRSRGSAGCLKSTATCAECPFQAPLIGNVCKLAILACTDCKLYLGGAQDGDVQRTETRYLVGL